MPGEATIAWRLGTATLGAILLAASLSPLARAAGKTTVQLTQVLATGSGLPKEFDPELKELEGQLSKTPYRVFKHVKTDRRDAAHDEELSYPLVSEPGYKLLVKIRGEGPGVVLAISIRDPKEKEVFSTRVKIKDGGTSIVGKELESKTGCIFLAFTVRRG